MLFLIEYDRENGQVVALHEFPDNESARANDERLALELSLVARKVKREVVLLQAPSLRDLQHTHRRYFATLSELASVARP